VAQKSGFKQVSDVSWEVPVSYKAGMRVPAKIYATRKLLDAMDAGVIEQVTNVACLPGIVKYAYAMADAHWGYGFPIGGVAAFDVEKGVISPGGIGFDINCLHPDSRVYDENGVWTRIADVDVSRQGFVTFDGERVAAVPSRAIAKQVRHESGAILRVTTELGRELLVTRDHPLMTKRGMVPAGSVSAGDQLLTSGVEGLSYSRPPGLQVLSADDLSRAMDTLGMTDGVDEGGRVVRQLRSLGLDSLYLDDPRTAQVLKVLGFFFGGGTMSGAGVERTVSFRGKAEDLEDVSRDLEALGFTSSLRNGRRTEPSLPADCSDGRTLISPAPLAVLLVALGAPPGDNAGTTYRPPLWLEFAEPWQKKLFLAAYFGAALTPPVPADGTGLQSPCFGVVGVGSSSESAIEFLEDIRALLGSLGIDSSPPFRAEGRGDIGGGAQTAAFRVRIPSDRENLLRLFGKVGYLYNREKSRLASVAACYLRTLLSVGGGIEGAPTRGAVGLVASESGGAGVLAQSVLPRGGVTGWRGVEKFEDFLSREAGTSGLVYDRVRSIESVRYEGPVYDVTIGDPNHNFVAEGVVVSNCGMRLIRTNLGYDEVRPKIRELVDSIFRLVPAGVGVKGFLRVNDSQFDEIMKYGVKWCAENGHAWEDDPSHVEEGGYIKGGDPSKVSRQARSRGIDQLGTLGSGNHYLEIQVVDPARHFDRELARNFGIVEEDQVLVMVHCGSRGFGHQIGSDYLRVFDGAMKRYGLEVKDRELACAPFSSREGKDYYGAMVCAANMAFTNRQIIVQRVREAFSRVFHRDSESLDMHLIYDVCHNVAKVENHSYDGSRADFLVHRKGATRSFGPGHPDIPAPYRAIGQPVIIGGSMETGSYLLLGTQKAMDETFGSTAHGSGRTMSRTAAKKEVRGAELQKRMLDRGIYVKAATMDGLAEEAGMAYKDISDVVETMDRAGISKKVVALRPIGNIKG
jgi:tRNA-splicing ligase RtcB